MRGARELYAARVDLERGLVTETPTKIIKSGLAVRPPTGSMPGCLFFMRKTSIDLLAFV